jgi:hypothetical protein
MRILLYSPDNGVTRNFMPHLWMFLLQAITPPGHEVILIDANARAMSDDEIVQFVREHNIGLVGIGAMTRMAEKAYRVADAIRAGGVPVVMGGPHVTERILQQIRTWPAGLTDLRPTHAVPVHATVQALTERWPTNQAETLAEV